MKYLDVDGVGQVSRIGLGTWQFGSREWGYGDDYASGPARDIVQRALALGVTLFDTAEIYGFGKSERILGEALGDERSKVAVASKVFPVAPFPAVVKQRDRASARRLQLDRIPLYQIHQPNPVVPDSVIMPGMRELLDSGVIGAAGVSNYSLQRWHKADAALGRPVISNQVSFSLAHPGAGRPRPVRRAREPHRDRLQPAGAGVARRQVRSRQPARRNPCREHAVRHRESATDRAAAADAARRGGRRRRKAGAGGAGLADRLPRVVAIPGASSVEQLEFNVAAADIELTQQSRDALTDAARAFRPVSTARVLADLVKEKLGRA